ncbi:conserved membrane protein of unknown function [Methylocella tundrae]|uniref:Acyltransferase 3 domain-containing protein n=1 Tax=Methylocella tundrae TaxID=227605 RepID=A0A4U8YY10_METTU|nr:conserved membrane protein of unknown function [Methylocella tundrae]
MAPGLSLYIDLFRFLAVLSIVISHGLVTQMGGDWLKFSLGLEAIEATFVLSGFVIAYVVATRERSLAVYSASRLARLWSIVLPALALTFILDGIGLRLSPAPYEDWGEYMGFDNPLLRLFLTAIFQNQTWFLEVSPLSNIPLWSIGYIAWYYAIFAAFMFSPRAWRNWIVAAVALFAGPQILLLMPGWLFGVWLYQRRDKLKLSPGWGLALYLGAPALIFALKTLHVSPWLFSMQRLLLGANVADRYLNIAENFLWQNLVGALICLHLLGAMAIAGRLGRLLRPAERAIRHAGALTFAIYAFHFPLELWIAAALHERPDGPVKTGAVVIGALVASAALGALVRPFYPRLKEALLLGFRKSGYRLAKALD